MMAKYRMERTHERAKMCNNHDRSIYMVRTQYTGHGRDREPGTPRVGGGGQSLSVTYVLVHHAHDVHRIHHMRSPPGVARLW